MQPRQFFQFPRSRPRDLHLAVNWVVADYRIAVSHGPHVKLEAITAVSQRLVERRNRILWNRFAGSGAAMAEKKRVVHFLPRRAILDGSVEIEIPDGPAGVGRFLGLLYRLLEFFLQQIGGMLLRLD